MSRNDERMYKAISLVEAGKDKRVVSEELDISYSTVVRWCKEYQTAKIDGTIDKLLDLDKLIIAQAGALMALPGAEETINGKVEVLTKGLSGLDKLQVDLQSSATAINSRIKSLVMSSESTSELSELTDCLCALQNAFFNSKGVQVNIQNNVDGSSKYGSFLNDKPTHN